MPAPSNVPDVEPDGRPTPGPGVGGRRPPWWRRALSAVVRSIGRPFGARRNERGAYRSLGREWRGNRRGGMTRRQALRAT